MLKKWICQNRNWVFQNFPFLENDFDALTDYELFCKMVEYAKSLVISNDKFVSELKTNLEEMYNEGKFDSFIEEIVNLQTTFTFNSVADMKSATNLVDGSFTRTSGYYSYNDGGGAFYKIRNVTNEDVIDDMFIIALDDINLIAEYIIQDNSINIKQMGCIGNHEFDNTSKLQAIIEYCETKGMKMLIPKGEYLITDTLYINDKITIEGIIDNRLWYGTSYHPMICGYLTNKPFIHISRSDNLYNWDYAARNLVESVHISNIRMVGSTPDGFSMTGIYASTYLSDFKNLTINGFYNDFALAGCYETIVDECRFTQSYQCIVLYNNNRTTVFNNVYCNASNNDVGSVIDNEYYIEKYSRNHMFNYCCIYSNVSLSYMTNLAIEASCYGIISRDSKLVINQLNIESITEYCIHTSINLRSDAYNNFDNVHFYNPNEAKYENAKMFYTGYHAHLNLKTVDSLPITNINDGDITNNSVARIYSYVSGEKIIPLSLSDNVVGASIVNKSHYTEQGFKVDLEFSDAREWGGSVVTTITGLPASSEEPATKYRYFACPTKTKNSITNLRVSGTGIIVDGSGTWIGGSSYLDMVGKINYEYEIK